MYWILKPNPNKSSKKKMYLLMKLNNSDMRLQVKVDPGAQTMSSGHYCSSSVLFHKNVIPEFDKGSNRASNSCIYKIEYRNKILCKSGLIMKLFFSYKRRLNIVSSESDSVTQNVRPLSNFLSFFTLKKWLQYFQSLY